jgi:hypothetical protein
MVGFLETLFANNKGHHIEFYTFTVLHSNIFMSGHHVVPQFSIMVPFHVSGHILCVAFRGRWIDRVDSILWPPISPDFTPLDFFLLGLCKKLCLYGQNLGLESLEARIGEATELVTGDMVHFMCQEMEHRLDICKVMDVTHVETNNVQSYLKCTLK